MQQNLQFVRWEEDSTFSWTGSRSSDKVLSKATSHLEIQEAGVNIGEDVYFIPENSMTIIYNTQEQIEYYHRYPDSLLMGLARIGGILALLKFGGLLNLYHKRLFESSFTEKLTSAPTFQHNRVARIN